MQNEERIDDDEKKRIWDEGRRSSRIDGMRIPLPSTCYWTITRLEAMEKTRLNSQEWWNRENKVGTPKAG